MHTIHNDETENYLEADSGCFCQQLLDEYGLDTDTIIDKTPYEPIHNHTQEDKNRQIDQILQTLASLIE